jgi:response regulator NasT
MVRIRILIVEDDRLVLTGLATGLEDRGYTIIKAASGEEAVLLADTARPDLVLIDICLPGISGIQAAQRIKEKLDIPVIFLSALDTEEVVREAITTGTLSYLVKPVTIKQLVPAIESALARGRDISRLRSSEENLAVALRQNREISVAIGVLMERHDLTAEDAFETLRANARSTRSTTSEVANGVISGALQLVPSSRVPGPRK